MRPLLLLAAGALLAAAPARATDLTLRLDLGYDRVDLLEGGGSGQQLDFDAALFGAGSFFAPGTLDWNLGAAWRGLRSTSVGGRTQDSDRLTFRGRLGILQRPSSPLTLVLFGERSQSDFTTEVGPARATGTITTTSYGADALYRSLERPTLRLGVRRTTTEDTGLGRAPSERNSLRLRGGTSHATQGYTFGADYDGELSDGTFDADNFDAHSVTVNATARVAPSVDARLTERWYLRAPTRSSPFNPRYEDNQLFASAYWTGARALSRTGYRFGHTLITAPTREDRERTVNAVSEQYEHQLTEPLRLIGIGAVTATEERLALASSRALGGSATLLARWLGRSGVLDLFAQGGGTGGFLDPEVGGTLSAFGLQAEAGLSGPLLGARAGARYAVTWQENLSAVAGWALRQSVSGDLEARPAADLSLRLSLQATADRLQSDVFGGGANRLVQLIGHARWRRLTADLTAGVSSGVLGAPTGGVHGDGLFVPAPYDTHSTFASLGASLEVTSSLDLRATTRYLDLRQPDRERQWEAGFLGGLSYRVGALSVSLEDEYVTGGGGRRASQNRFLVRITRAFGTRF